MIRVVIDTNILVSKKHFPDRWKKTKVIGTRELVELLMEFGKRKSSGKRIAVQVGPMNL